MSAALVATSVPTPQFYSSFLRVVDASSTPAGNAPISFSIPQGEIIPSSKMRMNATRSDLGSLYGPPPVFAIDTGLGLGVPTAGLTLTVSAGQSLGGVQLPTASPCIIPDNTDRTYVWMDFGTPTSSPLFTAVPNSLTPPAGDQIFLGSVSSTSGSILGADTSGVFYNRGGLAFRYTGDTATPTDAPPANISFVNNNANGDRHLWDGGRYNLLITSTASFGTTDPYSYTSTTFLTTGAVTATFTLTPTNDKETVYRASIGGRMSAGTSAFAGVDAIYSIRKQGGTVSAIFGAIGSPVSQAADNTAYTAFFSNGGTAGTVLLNVGGASGETMTWTLNVQKFEVG